MSEQERAAALADEISRELTSLRREFDGQKISLRFSEWDIVVSSLRAYSQARRRQAPNLRNRKGRP